MKKDLLLTVAGMLGIGAAVFGAGLLLLGGGPAAEVSAEPEADEHGKGTVDLSHGHAHASPEAEEIHQFQSKYNDLLARGQSDEARSTALKAMTLAGREDPAWMRRLADATYLSDSLPNQQRFQKAYELYAALLSRGAQGEDREWAQYRAGLCLRNQNRWEESLEAMDHFLKQHPQSAKGPEIRLLRAQSLLGLGEVEKARESLQELLKETLPGEIRAASLMELARLDHEGARKAIAAPRKASPPEGAEVVEVPSELAAAIKRVDGPDRSFDGADGHGHGHAPNNQHPATHGAKGHDAAKEHAGHTATDHHHDEPKGHAASKGQPADEEPKGVALPVRASKVSKSPAGAPIVENPDDLARELGMPPEQWALIRRSVDMHHFAEAQRLIAPWTEPGSPLTAVQKARVLLHFADAFREAAALKPRY